MSMQEQWTQFMQQNIAQMLDISAVRTNSTDLRIAEVVQAAKEHHCYLVTILPSQTLLAKSLLGDSPSIKLGGNVGFPSGGQTTSIKVAETLELVKMGVDEIDMVINVAAHLSNRYKDVLSDIRAVVEAADGRPVKVILECYYLNNQQICKGCDLAIEAGATFVKTGTGWTPTGATPENVSLIKQHVGDQIKIKASGGVRGLDMVLELYRRGATRFGISFESAMRIFKMANEMRPHVDHSEGR